MDADQKLDEWARQLAALNLPEDVLAYAAIALKTWRDEQRKTEYTFVGGTRDGETIRLATKLGDIVRWPVPTKYGHDDREVYQNDGNVLRYLRRERMTWAKVNPDPMCRDPFNCNGSCRREIACNH